MWDEACDEGSPGVDETRDAEPLASAEIPDDELRAAAGCIATAVDSVGKINYKFCVWQGVRSTKS